MSLPALYQLTDSFRALERLAEFGEEEIPPEVVRDTLEALQGDIIVKSTNVAKFVANLDVAAEAMAEAAAAMKRRADRTFKRAESLRGYLLVNMQMAGITKIDAPEFTIAVQKNPPAVVIDNEGQIPAAFMTLPPPAPPPVMRPDKKAIAAALKAGTDVPGTHLEQAERLVIKQ